VEPDTTADANAAVKNDLISKVLIMDLPNRGDGNFLKRNVEDKLQRIPQILLLNRGSIF
jgi:hypothetical protein